MVKIFFPARESCHWQDVLLSQAALKDAKNSKKGEDKEIVSLQVEVAVRMLACLLCSFICKFSEEFSAAASATYLGNIFYFLPKLECKRWGWSHCETASWSWIWSKISSIDDTKNDTDSERDGMYMHSLRSFLVVIWELLIWCFQFSGRSCS